MIHNDPEAISIFVIRRVINVTTTGATPYIAAYFKGCLEKFAIVRGKVLLTILF